MEFDAVETSIGRPQLVLRADVFLEHILLHADGLACQIALRDHLAVEGVKSVEQPNRERTAGPQSGARWEIGIMVDFQCLLDAHGRTRIPRTAGCLIPEISLTSSICE